MRLVLDDFAARFEHARDLLVQDEKVPDELYQELLGWQFDTGAEQLTDVFVACAKMCYWTRDARPPAKDAEPAGVGELIEHYSADNELPNLRAVLIGHLNRLHLSLYLWVELAEEFPEGTPLMEAALRRLVGCDATIDEIESAIGVRSPSDPLYPLLQDKLRRKRRKAD